MSPEEQLRIYEQDTNAEENIRKAITDAYGGLESEIDQVRMYENQQLPGFYNAFNGYGGGTGATDLSPTALLQRAAGDVANLSTTAQVARDAFDIRRAGMEDLIGSAYNQWQQGYAGAQNAYDRWFQQQQAEEEKRRWEEQMALERARLNRMGGGGGSPGINTVGADDNFTQYQNYLRQIYKNGGSVDPRTGESIVGMSLPGGGDLLWTTPKKTSAPKTTSVASNPGNGYFTPAPKVTPAGTSSSAFNRAVNNFRGI